MVAPLPRYIHRMTGRNKVRTNWRGKLIVQVEVAVWVLRIGAPCPPLDRAEESPQERTMRRLVWEEHQKAGMRQTGSFWRDATVEDIINGWLPAHWATDIQRVAQP